MKRFYPFALAILGALLLTGVMLLVVRGTHMPSIKPREASWRESLGRAFEKATKNLEEVGA